MVKADIYVLLVVYRSLPFYIQSVLEGLAVQLLVLGPLRWVKKAGIRVTVRGLERARTHVFF